MFEKMQKAQAENVYKTMQKNLSPKDGKTHIIMLNSFSKIANQNFDCDSKYTTEIDSIISAMQDDGYEIIDIKISSMSGQGLAGNRTGFNTMIIYK